MNLRVKVVFSIGVLGLLCLMLPGALRADTVYTYTGNPYTFCDGTYCTGGPYALSGTIDVTAGTPLDDLTYGGAGSYIAAHVSSYAFTDGSGLVHTPADSWVQECFIGTDGTGHITAWQLLIYTPEVAGLYFESSHNPDFTWDRSLLVGPGGDPIGYGESSAPGVWTMVSTPEPASSILLGTGLLGLLALAARSKRHAPPTSC